MSAIIENDGSEVAVGTKESYKYIGTRLVRPDGVDKVTGRANYGADLSLPGMLHGAILRSPHAHARIKRIDTSKALALDGVKAVVTGADMGLPSDEIAQTGEAETSIRDLSRNILARDKVLYDGHAVAAVAATSKSIALDALSLIEVDYEILPHVIDVRLAMTDKAPLLHEDVFTKGVDPAPKKPSNIASRNENTRGDLDEGFSQASVVLEREYTCATVHQGYIEPHACVARWSEDGQAVVHSSSQGQFMVRDLTASVLGLSRRQVKAIPAEIGGGFGGKTTVYVEPVAVLLARKSGRPVKLAMTRQEVFRASGPGPGSWIKIRMGVSAEGKITAVDALIAFEAGAFPGSAVGAAMMVLLGPYEVPHFRIVGLDVVVNKPRSAPYRAPGGPNAAHASETLLDEAAAALGLDPVEIRMRNAVKKGSLAVHGPRYPKIGYVETLQAVSQHPHFKAPLGPHQGRGIASGFWMNGGGQSSVQMMLNEDGTATVVGGCPDIGGTRAAQVLIAAEELGIDPGRINAVVADTESVGFNGVTGGSRVAFATGMAISNAARAMVDDLKRRAALIWGIEAQQVSWADGVALPGVEVSPEGESLTPLSVADIATKMGATGGPVVTQSSINARGVGPAFGTHIADVEVDPETGAVRVLRYTVVEDAGKALHPDYVEGQYQGGAAQGIGWALNEEYVYDDDGRLMNPGFLDYRIPVALDLPMIDTVIVEVPNPRHPYGSRGVGECPIVPPLPAIANAIHDAVGVRLYSLPMSPPKVLEAIEAAASAT